jgi:hypothetical protein
MGTPVTNFGKVTVSGLYDAAATSIALTTGHGSRLPSTFPFPLTWWNSTDYADPADDPNKEIIIVTARAGDVLTGTRGAESSGASTKNTSGKTYKMVLGITKSMWDGIFKNSLSQTFRGLKIANHPNADGTSAVRVQFSADAITMSDGQEVADWPLTDTVLNGSGVNGLDTGSEAASTVYELYAIYNGVTKAGMFHKAPDYTIDVNVATAITEDATQGCRSAVDNSTVKVSQGITTVLAGPLSFIDVKLIKVGAPTGTVVFTLEANAGGVPSNTPLATSRRLDVSRISTTAQTVRIIFDTPYAVSAATVYHLVMQGTWTVSATNYVGWRMDGSAAPYAGGSKALFDSDTSTWTADTDDDMMVTTYIKENDVALTLPAGYTQYALIHPGIVNNAAGDIKHFWARDREVFCGYDPDWKLGGFANTIAAIVDLRQFLPPRAAMLRLNAYNGSACNIAVGALGATDLDGTVTNERIGSIRATLNTAYALTFGPVPIEFQGMMVVTSAGTLNLYVSSYTW